MGMGRETARAPVLSIYHMALLKTYYSWLVTLRTDTQFFRFSTFDDTSLIITLIHSPLGGYRTSYLVPDALHQELGHKVDLPAEVSKTRLWCRVAWRAGRQPRYLLLSVHHALTHALTHFCGVE